ncbi:pyruvate, water dikinase regulatory protein [Guggenheimella bovis]
MNKIIAVSDSIGETARAVLQAGLAQFDGTSVVLEVVPFIDTKKKLQELFLRLEPGDFVCYTLVDPALQKEIQTFTKERGIFSVNLLQDVIDGISHVSGLEPLRRPGRQNATNEAYFKRIEAMEFAVKYDDGKTLHNIDTADIILLGISRTSKTPLSMYLATLGYKVANIPILPEVTVPEVLFSINKSKLFGLTNDAKTLVSIRQERMKAFGFGEGSLYAKVEHIEKELAFSNELFERLQIPVINVNFKSIEEVASSILRIVKERP